MYISLLLVFVILLIYFPAKRVKNREENLGKRHLENLEQLDPHARAIIENWVAELRSELSQDKLDSKTLNRLIGLKIAQARSTEELGVDFKELPKSLD